MIHIIQIAIIMLIKYNFYSICGLVKSWLMFYSYNVIMNKKLCLAEAQKSTEKVHCIEKTLLARMNRFPLRSGSLSDRILHRYDVYKVYRHDDKHIIWNNPLYDNMKEKLIYLILILVNDILQIGTTKLTVANTENNFWDGFWKNFKCKMLINCILYCF